MRCEGDHRHVTIPARATVARSFPPRPSRLGPPASALLPRPSCLGPPASALLPRPSLALAKALLLTTLALLAVLLCTLSAHAQSGYPGSGYPGGSGSGYPGGSGSGYPGGSGSGYPGGSGSGYPGGSGSGYPGGSGSGYPGGSGSGYPGGSGSGYPGGSGSGYPGGTSPDPGHYWKITYSNTKGKTTWAILNSPSAGQSTPQEYDWPTQVGGDGLESESYINTSSTGSVTATLTWIPDPSLTSDPPPATVYIQEFSTAEESPSIWNEGQFNMYVFPAPTGVGSADDGLGDEAVPFYNGYSSSGVHRVKEDGSSGTITLGPFTLTASCPDSSWQNNAPPDEHDEYSWDWTGGLCEVGFSVAVSPPPYPINFRQDSVINLGDGVLTFHYSWDSSTGNQSDLVDWVICEKVTYADNPAGKGSGFYGYDQENERCYFPPDPFDGRHPEPTQLNFPGTDRGCFDDQRHTAFSTPYKEASYVATQWWAALNGTTGAQIVLAGPFTITRSVNCTRCTAEGDYYEYVVTKNGSEADLDLGTGL